MASGDHSERRLWMFTLTGAVAIREIGLSMVRAQVPPQARHVGLLDRVAWRSLLVAVAVADSEQPRGSLLIAARTV